MTPQKKRRFSWLLLSYVLTWGTIPHVLLTKKRPAACLAWIWSIIALPFFGPLAYLIFGADRMRRKRLRKARRLGLSRRAGPREVQRHLRELSSAENELLRTLGNINQIPPSTAEQVRLLIDAPAFYDAFAAAVDAAEHHVHVEFFIWRADEAGRRMLEPLVRAARRGVHVRLLLDEIGCLGVRKAFFKPLIQAGGEFSWFYSLPLWRHSRFMNLRNHRKLQIIDGRVAFVGGMNVGREYLGLHPALGSWHDGQLQVEGNVVHHLQEIFTEDWFFATDQRIQGPEYFRRSATESAHVVQVISGGPDLPREPIPKSMVALLGGARKRVWLTTGYFVPNQLFLTALQICAARGVDVRLLVSRKTDHPYLLEVGRSYYEDLLHWGVRVFEYSEAIYHMKSMLLDDEWLMIGSANSDNRSMRLNFELNLLVHAPELAAQFEEMLGRELGVSEEITLNRVKARPFRRRLLEAALRPLAPLL